MAMNRAAIKRQKELARQRKKKEKAEKKEARRREREAERAELGTDPEVVDPDLAGMTPGPQNRPDWVGELDEDEDEEDD